MQYVINQQTEDSTVCAIAINSVCVCPLYAAVRLFLNRLTPWTDMFYVHDWENQKKMYASCKLFSLSYPLNLNNWTNCFKRLGSLTKGKSVFHQIACSLLAFHSTFLCHIVSRNFRITSSIDCKFQNLHPSRMVPFFVSCRWLGFITYKNDGTSVEYFQDFALVN